MIDIPAAAEILWAYHRDVPRVGAFDAIVCLGSYDESVARHAASLHLANPSAPVLFTGRQGNWTGGLYAATEAEHFAAIAAAMGVPHGRIRIEPEATNIGENIAFSEALLPPDPGSVVFVTKPQTQRRLHLTLKARSRLQAWHVAAPERSLREAVELFGLAQIVTEMVGDLDRVLKYPTLGFMAPDTVPDDVMAAFEALKRGGFGSHLVKG